MDFDTLFTGAKWRVLSLLAQKEMAPTEIAKVLQTTVANVSMQLRLLEVGGIVQKRRITNSAAGKPRILYSLQKSVLFYAAAAKHVQTRQLIELDEMKSIIVKVWQLPKTVQGPLLQFYFNYADLFSDEFDVYFSEYGDHVCKLVIVNDKKSLPPKIIQLKYRGENYAIDVRFVEAKKAAKLKRLQLLHKGGWDK